MTIAYTNQPFCEKAPTLPEVLEVPWQGINPMTGKEYQTESTFPPV